MAASAMGGCKPNAGNRQFGVSLRDMALHAMKLLPKFLRGFFSPEVSKVFRTEIDRGRDGDSWTI
jgi:hypothetical protein